MGIKVREGRNLKASLGIAINKKEAGAEASVQPV